MVRNLALLAIAGSLSTVATAPSTDVTANVAGGRAPLNVLIICDASKSGGGANLASVGSVNPTRAELIRAIDRYLNDGDSVRVASFGDRFLLSPRWTRRFGAIWQAFESVTQTLGDTSPIWDAIYSSVDAFEGTVGRRVVFLVSDGKASGNVHGFDAAVDHARSSNVTVYVVNVVGRNTRGVQADQPTHPAARLKKIAEATRGDYTETVTKALPAFFGNVVKKLNASVARQASILSSNLAIAAARNSIATVSAQ